MELPIELSNEFTSVSLSIENTGNGARLRITSPRLGYSVDLDPIELEALSWQTPEFFSELLGTPFGPGIAVNSVSLSELIALQMGPTADDIGSTP